MGKRLKSSLHSLFHPFPAFFKKKTVSLPQKTHPTIALALGGGAVWGISHIGILKVLENHHIPVHYMSGTSIGALVGGLYAAGIPLQKLYELAISTQWKNLSKLSLPLGGILSNEPMEFFICNLIGNKTFEDLKIPFVAVATDLLTGEEIILHSGKLSTAIRASTAIPGIFHPIHINNRTLVDGGVVSNVPVHAVKGFNPDITIAVNLVPSLEDWLPSNSLETILKSLFIMQQKVVAKETSQADLVINLSMKGFSPIDFSKAKELYQKGMMTGLSYISRIQEIIEKKKKELP
ncbi:patatin-like phospholipase family protein [Thermotalea metallivorans]|uniref:Putative NTE family protein n=1 Tax=Thermotalea metallivorans TaxID=520762 RepID=A0A140L158_9FIRM|nr:patatin-like phospholipase family protein [Thermotalea metallivorans]KXG74283.1 putative NTE family protein [Thermotalea metallivorans]